LSRLAAKYSQSERLCPNDMSRSPGHRMKPRQRRSNLVLIKPFAALRLPRTQEFACSLHFGAHDLVRALSLARASSVRGTCFCRCCTGPNATSAGLWLAAGPYHMAIFEGRRTEGQSCAQRRKSGCGSQPAPKAHQPGVDHHRSRPRCPAPVIVRAPISSLISSRSRRIFLSVLNFSLRNR
jgi:hypothetical protein